ncbi:hypothetical protein GTP45_20365 [Pseudoduganella sp. FT55W]|uniref:Uncharacterized protein n=1 Tax=Duganella rivi TaxID=2666083 RepID=A0A7X4KDA9_9BURK|nr:hypothetical protein [Duganella rivi]
MAEFGQQQTSPQTKKRNMSSEISQLRTVAQVALLTHITPRVRSISLDLESSERKICFRVYTDGVLSESALEALSCAVTEIEATLGFRVDEEYLVVPEPGSMEHFPVIVYARCEDSWVDRG